MMMASVWFIAISLAVLHNRGFVGALPLTATDSVDTTAIPGVIDYNTELWAILPWAYDFICPGGNPYRPQPTEGRFRLDVYGESKQNKSKVWAWYPDNSKSNQKWYFINLQGAEQPQPSGSIASYNSGLCLEKGENGELLQNACTNQTDQVFDFVMSTMTDCVAENAHYKIKSKDNTCLTTVQIFPHPSDMVFGECIDNSYMQLFNFAV